MSNNIYEKIKRYIKNNWLFLLIVFLFVSNFFIKIPYEVEMPGGIIDLSDRVLVDGEKLDIKGSFNMAYVSMVEGSIPYTLIGLINPDWEVVSTKDIVLENETIEESRKRDKIYLEQSKNSATIAALEAAKIPYEIKNKITQVIYIASEADTDIEIGDYILKCDDIEVDDVSQVKSIINSKNKGDKISFTIKRDNKELVKEATIFEEDGELFAGISIATTFDIDCDKNIEIKSRASESGPSGGLMMSLMIYNALTNQDLTKGKKVVGTGTISTDGLVGEIGGVKYKVMGAFKNKADIFLAPEENYEEAVAVKNEKNYDIDIVKVTKLQDAIDYLEGLDE